MDDDRDGYINECWLCREPSLPVGVLGKTLHYNCKACGLWWNSPVPIKEQEDANS